MGLINRLLLAQSTHTQECILVTVHATRRLRTIGRNQADTFVQRELLIVIGFQIHLPRALYNGGAPSCDLPLLRFLTRDFSISSSFVTSSWAVAEDPDMLFWGKMW